MDAERAIPAADSTETGEPQDLGQGAARLRWLIYVRVLITSFLLGIAGLIQVSGAEAISEQSLYLVLAVIGVTYFLSGVYIWFARLWGGAVLNVSIQSVADIVLITALVYVTGGVGSIYSMLYTLVIIYAALFLGRRGCLLIASLSAICYGGLLDLEYFGYIHPTYGEMYRYSFSAGYVFSRVFIHIVFFYIIAVLAIYAVEREKKATSLLVEREDSFKRLDLLHRSIIESVNAGIVTVDKERIVRSFNRAAEKITGRDRGWAVGRSLEEVLPGVPSTPDGESIGGNFEATVRSEEGRQVILGFSRSHLMGPSSKPMGDILIFHDLTVAKTMEQEMERNRKLAFLGEMAAVLAHELRNPLAAIGGSIQVLRRDLVLDGGDRKLMDIILRGKNQLENLARDFLLLARSKAGDADTIDVPEMIDEILESVTMGADWKEGTILTRNYSDIRTIHGNRSEVGQAVLNIVTNALQAMSEDEELAVETRVVNAHNGGDTFLEIEIRDRAGGIDPVNLERVREPFFTTRETGTGLGLAIVERVMGNHGGYLCIISESGCTRSVLGFPLSTVKEH